MIFAVKQKGEQMAEYVDLAERVTATFYSDEYEGWTQKTVTIADVLNAVCDDYTVLPSAQPGWIPCSESPMKNNSYLVWMPFAPEGHHITVAEWCGSYWNIKTPITAWMPLPKPWKGGRNA